MWDSCFIIRNNSIFRKASKFLEINLLKLDEVWDSDLAPEGKQTWQFPLLLRECSTAVIYLPFFYSYLTWNTIALWFIPNILFFIHITHLYPIHILHWGPIILTHPKAKEVIYYPSLFTWKQFRRIHLFLSILLVRLLVGV